jgi:hypothetical protein
MEYFHIKTRKKVFKKYIKKYNLKKNRLIKKHHIKKNSIKRQVDHFVSKFCVFLGREKNIKILHKYIELSLKENIIDEYHMFNFSRNMEDNLYIKHEFNRLLSIFPNRVFLYNDNDNKNKTQENIQYQKVDWSPFYSKFSNELNDENSVIIKCDDDILFIDIYALKDAIKDRWNDKKSFLIHSNCINNGVCAYYLKDKFQKISHKISAFPKGGLLGILFEKPEFAYAMHSEFTNELLDDLNNLNKYIIDDVYFTTRISINFILIHGQDIKHLINVKTDDEYELSSKIPERLLRPNKIKGDLITSHYSYKLQDRILLARHELIENYEKLCDKYMNEYKNISFQKNIPLKLNISYKKRRGIYSVPNWINENHIYIKNIDTGKYIYYDYKINKLQISSTKKTLFEKIVINNENKIFYIMNGIYYLSKYNVNGNFKNESVLIKNMLLDNEKYITCDSSDKDGFYYIKFLKYNEYLSVLDNNLITTSYKKSKWIFEKPVCDKDVISVKRYQKYGRYFYKNIDNNEIYSNIYLGWSYENIIW